MKIRIVCFIVSCLVLGIAAVAQETSASNEAPVNREALVKQLVDLRDHMHTAFGVAPTITHLEPDIGLEIAQTAWPDLANDKVKTGVLKAFAFSKGLPEQHPRILRVLHLGMTDASDYVREYASFYLVPYALQDFSEDDKGYQQWYEQYGAMSLEQLRSATRSLLHEKVQELEHALSGTDQFQIMTIADQLGGHGDALAIPFLIGMIEADNTEDTIYGIGYPGLGKLTSVQYSDDHDGQWWHEWWVQHKTDYPDEVQQIDVPDYRKQADIGKAKRAKQKSTESQSDVADIPSKKLQAGGDANKTYFLIGPKISEQPPEMGYGVLVVLPGGDGSDAFHPFVKRIYKNALPENYLVLQPVAPKWTEDQVIVWPHQSNTVTGMKFTTEEFIEDVITDVGKRFIIDPRHVFTLSWSSSGPAAYAISLQEKTAITGSYVAMSVYNNTYLPPLTWARDRTYYIEHSQADKVCPFWMAEQARDELTEANANVKFSQYDGGHGWRGNVYERMRTGITWLESNTN